MRKNSEQKILKHQISTPAFQYMASVPHSTSYLTGNLGVVEIGSHCGPHLSMKILARVIHVRIRVESLEYLRLRPIVAHAEYFNSMIIVGEHTNRP